MYDAGIDRKPRASDTKRYCYDPTYLTKKKFKLIRHTLHLKLIPCSNASSLWTGILKSFESSTDSYWVGFPLLVFIKFMLVCLLFVVSVFF